MGKKQRERGRERQNWKKKRGKRRQKGQGGKRTGGGLDEWHVPPFMRAELPG